MEAKYYVQAQKLFIEFDNGSEKTFKLPKKRELSMSKKSRIYFKNMTSTLILYKPISRVKGIRRDMLLSYNASKPIKVQIIL